MSPMNPEQDGVEILIQDISQRIESLKTEFNLYFSGEIRVPPEKDRVALEKKIRNLMYSGKKTARINLLVQNVSSRFSLFNNMWMKRMNEIETGVSPLQRKKVAILEMEKENEKGKKKTKPPRPARRKGVAVPVSLNREDSFDKLFDNYAAMMKKESKKVPDKEKMINSIKTKMITSNVIDAKVALSLEKGKLKIKIKSSN
ncbi:MAG: hypothetical protein GY940_01615 [bacterium]|nr:hypothetical protein [bacterium]